jgi:hypothetical protein
LQKVLQIPAIGTSADLYHAMKLGCMDFTVEELKFKATHSQPAYAVMYTEELAGKRNKDIASCFYRYYREATSVNKDAKAHMMFVDNCAAQSKSWQFFTSLQQMLNAGELHSLQTIEVNIIFNKFNM